MNKITTLIVFASLLMITSSLAGTADAELLTIEGDNGSMGIFLAVEDTQNVIVLDTIDDSTEHLDSNVKSYHTGAFSLKNPETGVAIWAHPFSDTQYRIVVVTPEGVFRIIGTVV